MGRRKELGKEDPPKTGSLDESLQQNVESPIPSRSFVRLLVSCSCSALPKGFPIGIGIRIGTGTVAECAREREGVCVRAYVSASVECVRVVGACFLAPPPPSQSDGSTSIISSPTTTTHRLSFYILHDNLLAAFLLACLWSPYPAPTSIVRCILACSQWRRRTCCASHARCSLSSSILSLSFFLSPVPYRYLSYLILLVNLQAPYFPSCAFSLTRLCEFA